MHLIHFFSIVIILRISSMSSQYVCMCACFSYTMKNVYQLFPKILNLHFLSNFKTFSRCTMFHQSADLTLITGICLLHLNFSIPNFFFIFKQNNLRAPSFLIIGTIFHVNKNFSTSKPFAHCFLS